MSIHKCRIAILGMLALLLTTVPVWAQVSGTQTSNGIDVPCPSQAQVILGSPRVITRGSDLLTLRQAIALARANNRQLLTANDEVEKSRKEVKAAETALSPKVDLVAGAACQLAPSSFHFDKGAFGTYPGIGPVPGAGTDITESGNSSLVASVMVTQPITQIPRIRRGIGIKQQMVSITHEAYRTQSLELATDVTKVYTSIGVINQVIVANDASIRFLKELEHVVQTNFDQGTVLESDLLDVRAKLARQEHAATTLQHERTDLCEQLNQLMGRGVSDPVTLSNETDHADIPQSLQDLQSYALQNFPGVRQSSAGVVIAQNDYDIRRRETRPDVSVALSYTRQQQLDVLPDQLFLAMVVAKWDSAVDWGKNRAELSEKRLGIEQAKRTYADAREKTILNVNAHYRKWQDALAYVDVCKKDAHAREEVLRVDTERYQANAIQLKDVLESEAKLYDARQQLYGAQADVITAQGALMSAIGKE